MRKTSDFALGLCLVVILVIPVFVGGEAQENEQRAISPVFGARTSAEDNVTEPMPVILYMHGQGDPAELKPVFPSNGSGNSAPPSRTGGALLPNKPAWLVGRWSTIPLAFPMSLEPAVNAKLWATGSGQDVFFYINIYRNDQQIKQMSSDTKSVTGDTDFYFSDTIEALELSQGDTLSIWIYSGSRIGSNYELAWGSSKYDSHIQISCNALCILVNPPLVNKDVVTFSCTVFDAFDLPGLTAHIRVKDTIEVVSLSEPKFTKSENSSLIAWDWNHKADGAKEGEYTVTVNVCYDEENEFAASESFLIEFPIKEEAPGFIERLGILFPVILLAIIVCVVVVTVRLIMTRKAD